MKVQLLCCSESCSIDMQTNRLSMFHIFDGIAVVSTPYLVPSLSIILIASKDHRDKGPIACQVSLRCGSVPLGSIPFSMEFGAQPLARNITTLQGVLIPTLDDLHVTLTSKGKQLAEWVINVTAVATSRMAPEPVAPVSIAKARTKARPAKKPRRAAKR